MTKQKREIIRRQDRHLRIKIKREGPEALSSKILAPAFSAHDPVFGCAARPYIPDIFEVIKTIRRRTYSLMQRRSSFQVEGIAQIEAKEKMKEYLEAANRQQDGWILNHIYG